MESWLQETGKDSGEGAGVGPRAVRDPASKQNKTKQGITERVGKVVRLRVNKQKSLKSQLHAPAVAKEEVKTHSNYQNLNLGMMCEILKMNIIKCH